MGAMRDLRDPQKLGERLRELRGEFPEITMSVLAEVTEAHGDIPDYASTEGPIEKYGRPGDHKPVWERIRIK